ncbi:MAG: tRNA uridine-5-carboxymethylaminomethyl(34) synthesis GTPase MnmE [Deltaproteobacteria bacterium]|nr:tRNA uridine-5-carboxymethylaminomethyl(34) synthesis GTPase MnmE [Deltaproteobacteria bacterium]
MAAENETSNTIAAISTPSGAGGIGVIRMSGPHALTILQQIFQPHDPACSFRSHQLYYGHILVPGISGQKKIVDEVLAVYMRAPSTYTREDVVEIHGHGNFLVLQSILELLLHYPVRLAEPGEFTKRAFLNGRIDLTQAEAVIDLLSARTKKGIEMAQGQLSGRLYDQVDAIRQALMHMRAIVEVAIDFPDEDHEIINHSELTLQLETSVRAPLAVLLRNAEQGKIFREGITVVIAGLPNVGKSSLLNTLLQEERALVTAIPGTTRDTIEEYLDIEGVPVRIVDTAGIRDNAEEVEELGIQRAKRQIGQADLVLFMIDPTKGISAADHELFYSIQHKPVILVANKMDLLPQGLPDLTEFGNHALAQVLISARKQQGITELKQAIFKAVVGNSGQWEEDSCAPNLRHKDALARAYAASNKAIGGLQSRITSDLLAIDLQECLTELDAIVGVTTTEDILDLIFKQFCLGK